MHATTLLSALAGGLLGVRHAFEPDHLAAVATLSERGTDEDRPPSGVALAKNALLGAWWGVGHTAALLVVIAVFSTINATMAPAVEQVFELAVAAMLMLLGVSAIVRSYRTVVRGPNMQRPSATHHHAQAAHTHAGGAHIHFGRNQVRTLHWRPLMVGSIHGLAGSGALLILVATQIDSVPGRLLYALMFGLGSVLGMAAMTAASGLMMQRVAASTQRWLHRGLGACSIAMGVWWAALTLAR
ncbi:MAG: hypothetical protein KBG15_16430 [Kofleriaceae bacterium]|nr:hypothetical protein [Kofleriaceae bacterium]